MQTTQETTHAPQNGAARGAPVHEVDSHAAAPATKKRRPFLVLAVVALVVVGGVGGYAAMTAGEEDTDDAQVMSDLVPIGSQVSGQVIKVNIRENDLVKKDQILVEVQDADYVAKLKQAEADLATAIAQQAEAESAINVVQATSQGGLATARAAVTGSTVSVGSAAARVEAARAGVLAAETALKKAQIDLARTKELRAANAVPQERLDNAQLAVDGAQAQLAQARAQQALAEEDRHAAQERVSEARGRLSQSSPVEAQLKVAQAGIERAKARVAAAKTAVDLATLQLGYTKIKAPADGIASRLSVHEGQLVSIGLPVVELVPVQTYVVANFKETQIGKMKPGQEADIRIDTYPGKVFHGKVESLSGGTGAAFSLLPADNASGNFVKVVQRVPVRIAWEGQPDVPLRAGLSADATVKVGK